MPDLDIDFCNELTITETDHIIFDHGKIVIENEYEEYEEDEEYGDCWIVENEDALHELWKEFEDVLAYNGIGYKMRQHHFVDYLDKVRNEPVKNWPNFTEEDVEFLMEVPMERLTKSEFLYKYNEEITRCASVIYDGGYNGGTYEMLGNFIKKFSI